AAAGKILHSAALPPPIVLRPYLARRLSLHSRATRLQQLPSCMTPHDEAATVAAAFRVMSTHFGCRTQPTFGARSRRSPAALTRRLGREQLDSCARDRHEPFAAVRNVVNDFLAHARIPIASQMRRDALR